MRFLSVLLSGAILVPLMLVGCQTSDEETKIYPISPGRYYSATELKTVTRSNISEYEDFTATGGYQKTVFSGVTMRVADSSKGIWYYGESSKLLYRQFSGSSLIQATNLRIPSDSAFETCNESYAVCFQQCSGPVSEDPGNQCYHYTSYDTATLWTRFIK